MSDLILEEGRSGGSYTHGVIDLAGVRVARGWKKYRAYECEHKNIVYSTADRRIECRDCAQVVDAFDAFLTLCKYFDKMRLEAQADRQRAWEAEQASIHRIAAKELQRVWSHKMAAGCPHCKRGLLPEDFKRGPSFAVSRETEIAARKRAISSAKQT